MAFRFGDPGGRMYTSVGTSNVNILAHWTAINSSAWTVSASNGRTSGSCLRISAGNQGTVSWLTKTLGAQATWGIAFGFRQVSTTASAALTLCAFQDVATTQVDLRINTDLTLSVTRNGTVLATSTSALSANTYYHIEFKATIHNTAGNYEVRVNGTSTGWVPAQGGTANTRATANNSANIVLLGNTVANGTITWDFDDVIVYDAQTTDANGFTGMTGFIGDCGLAWILPDGAGTTTQFTPSTGNNYAAVDDATPNGDTDYAESSTVAQIDTYSLASLPSGATSVKAVAVVNYARKTDVASRGMKAEVRSGGGNTAHATEQALSDTYSYYFSPFDQNPNAGSAQAWTVVAVNALEAGQTVSS